MRESVRTRDLSWSEQEEELRRKKEEERFKNQVCLCLRIKCIRFLGLGYGD